MRVARLVFLAPALVLLSAVSAGAASYMVGTWFGYGQPEDRSSMYIDRMRADGTWRGEYRTCAKGKATDQVQTGRWALTGDILTLGVETVDGMFAPRNDTYRMLAHDAQSQKYLSLAWKFPYTPKRVADNFQMPPCDLVS
jgi:hypothetical protein